MAIIPAFGIISGYTASKISQTDIEFFTVLRYMLIILGIDGLSIFIFSFTGMYKISFLAYLIHLIIFVSCVFLISPIVKTIMVHNFKHISGMASGIQGGGRNIISTFIAYFCSHIFDGNTGNPSVIMYCIAALILAI